MTSIFSDLSVLESIARTGSVAAAARELSVAPSTVYRRVASLESRLGTPCLVRGEGLNGTGRRLATVAGRAAANAAAIVRRATIEDQELRGTVSLTTVTGFSPILAPVLAQITREHPGLLIEMHILDGKGVSVRDRAADIALSLLANPPSQLVGKKLRRVRYAVFGLAALAHQGASASWVTLSRPMHTTPQAQWEDTHVPKDRVVVSTGNTMALVEFVRQGVGIGVLPIRLAKRYPELVPIPFLRRSLSKLSVPVWILTRPELRRTARVRCVMSAIADALGH